MIDNKQYSCKDCVNRNSDICEICTRLHFPSGRESKPTHFEPTIKSSILRVSVDDMTVPPIGLKPKFIHDEDRAIDIGQAIVRYLNRRMPIPIEWVEEYNEIRTKEKLAGSKNKPQ